MANPNYPMQPMPQQPAQQQPQQRPPPQPDQAVSPVVRNGAPKAVPVVVSAGLAIGVFCGLLFGVGIDKEEAVAGTATAAEPDKADAKPATKPEPEKPKTAVAKPKTVAVADAKTGSGSDTKVAEPTAAVPEKPPEKSEKPPEKSDGSAAVVAPPPAAKLIGKLTITVKPDAIAKSAKIFVDGVAVENNQYTVDLTDKLDTKTKEARTSVKVAVKAAGYKDLERSVEIVASARPTSRTSLLPIS